MLLVGGGGREHALAWKLSQSPLCGTLFNAPGNPGIAAEPRVTAVPELGDDHASIVAFCQEQDVQLVFVGPEAPLVDGLVDALQAANVPAFGPTRSAAQLEGSKVFMKVRCPSPVLRTCAAGVSLQPHLNRRAQDLCKKYNIPTASYEVFTEAAAAKEHIRQLGAPIVVKAAGLAAGKGVIVATSVEEACSAVTDILDGGRFGAAGSSVVVERFLDGEEASFFALIDGSKVVALSSAQDHKPAYDGDVGPNTGGMGAYSPAPVFTPEIEQQVRRDCSCNDDIWSPTPLCS